MKLKTGKGLGEAQNTASSGGEMDPIGPLRPKWGWGM